MNLQSVDAFTKWEKKVFSARIDEENLNNIFDMFFSTRSQNSHTQKNTRERLSCSALLDRMQNTYMKTIMFSYIAIFEWNNSFSFLNNQSYNIIPSYPFWCISWVRYIKSDF